MNIVIVYESQFGNTEQLARSMASALEDRHCVRVARGRAVNELTNDGIDLLFVGAPTQVHGLRLLVRPFLGGLRSRGFAGTPVAAFDTRMEGTKKSTGSAADVIAQRLQAGGCRLVAQPEGFVVSTLSGPLAAGEEDRGRAWALGVVEQLAIPAAI
jgi:flavodoxin I